MAKPTKEQAEAAFASVKEQWASFIEEGYGPILVEEFDWATYGQDGYPWAISWEMGPDDWAYEAGPRETEGDEEGTPPRVPSAQNWPDGVWLEAVNHWSVALYLEG